MNILFVLSGGGPEGIDTLTGAMKAMKEANIIPSYYSGTSAGAIVSTYCACNNYDTEKMEKFVRSLDNSLLDYRNFWYLREYWLSSMMSNIKIKKLLDSTFPVDFPDNLSIWATNCRNRKKINVADYTIAGKLPTAVLASMSIRGIWDPVRLNDGDDYVDGGFRFNLPYDKSIFPNYDQVWLIVASGKPTQYISGQTDLIKILRQDIAWLVESSTLEVIEENIDDPKVKVIWPFVETPDMSFDHSLIDKAYEETKRQLKHISDANDSMNSLKLCKKLIVSEVRSFRK